MEEGGFFFGKHEFALSCVIRGRGIIGPLEGLNKTLTVFGFLLVSMFLFGP